MGMIIKTQEDWITLAGSTIPLLPAYMSEFGNIDEYKAGDHLLALYEAKNWPELHTRFEEIWAWLPDTSSIRHRPFFDLCDLCSEYWVFEENDDPVQPTT
jgi:hypothetical protein